MTGPAYHGWTHRPKSEGGTDPIPGLSSSGPISLPVAFGFAGQLSRTGTVIQVDFNSISWNDDTVFNFAKVTAGTPNVARYVTVTPGTYVVKAEVDFASAFTQNTSIQITCYFPSLDSSDLLANTVGVDSFTIEQSGIWNEQKTTDEKAHLSLHDEYVFSWTTAGLGEDTLGLGVQLTLASSATKNIGGGLAVIRLGDAATEQTIS